MSAISSRSSPGALAATAPWFAGLLAIALIAFWPTYLSRPAAASSYTHLHAITATMWMVMLVAQPLAIRSRRLVLHRYLGRFSFALAPILLAAIVLLAHSRLQGLGAKQFFEQTYTLYLQLSLAALWALCYALAIANRRTAALHARFMVCTGLTLIDPVVIRLMIWIDPSFSWNYQWFTFGLTDAVFVALIVLERRTASGRGVFPAMLAIFMLLQAPFLLGLTQSAPWQAFSRWFAALPLT